jgi:hypothetical protein
MTQENLQAEKACPCSGGGHTLTKCPYFRAEAAEKALAGHHEPEGCCGCIRCDLEAAERKRGAEMDELRSSYEHYEAALASARKMRDKRLYELTEIAYLASMRPYLKAVFALTPAKGKEK